MGISANSLRAGRAIIDLSLVREGFEKELATLQNRMRAVGDKLAAIGRIGAAAGGTIVGVFAAATKQFVASGDALAKMATRTGLAVETLSALQFAADQSGTSLEAVEKASRGLARTLLDAGRGSLTAQQNLADLGLTLDQLRGKAPDQQFLSVADALSRIEDPSTRAALAMEVFGRAGTDLLPMLEQGAGGINKLIAEAHELGIVLSKEDAKAAEELNDAFGRLGFQFRAIMKDFAVAISGELLAFLNQAKDIGRTIITWTKANHELLATIAKFGVVLSGASIAIIALGTALRNLATVIGTVRVAITFLSAHPLVALATALGAAAVAALHFSGALEKVWEWLSRLGGAPSAAADEFRELAASMQTAVEQQRELTMAEKIADLERQIRQSEFRLKRRQRNVSVDPVDVEKIGNEQARLARLRKELAALQPKQAEPADPLGFGDIPQADMAKTAIDFALEVKDKLTRAIREALGEATEKVKPIEKAKKAADEKFRDAEKDPIALFDTRLAAQAFGNDPVQRQQLEEQKRIRKAVENRRGGLPVV